MDRQYTELGFDVLIAIAAGIGIVTYMLGILLDPLPALGGSIALVLGGVVTLVPRDERATAGVIGLTAVGLAGIVIPRAVTSLGDGPVPIGDELSITLAFSGFTLLITYGLLRMTAFRRRDLRAT